MPLPLLLTFLLEVASVASGVAQVVSPGANTWKVTAPVAPTAPLRVATSLIVAADGDRARGLRRDRREHLAVVELSPLRCRRR